MGIYYPQNMVSILGPRLHSLPSPISRKEGQGNTYPVIVGDFLEAWRIYITFSRSHSYLVVELIGSEVCVTQKPRNHEWGKEIKHIAVVLQINIEPIKIHILK